MVLPVAALPFLGIGGAALLAPHVLNYRDKTVGRYQARALEGVDQSDPQAMARALFSAGLIGGQELQDDTRAGFESAADRQAAMERQRVASGPGYMNAQLAREQWQLQLARDDMRNKAFGRIASATGMPEIYKGIPSLEQSWVETHAGNTYAELNRNTRQVMEDEVAISTAEQALETGQTAWANRRELEDRWRADPVYSGFGMPTTADGATDWAQVSTMLGPSSERPAVDMSPQQIESSFDTMRLLGPAADAVSDAILWAQETTRGGRAFNDADQAALQSRIDNAVIPAIARAREMGAIDQEEAKRLEAQLGLAGAGERGEVMVSRMSEVLQYLEDVIAAEQTWFESGTTAAQRQALGYGRREARSGSAAPPPPGTVAGVSE